MASGKTTFGTALAKKLQREFIDLDQYIEKKTGMTVSEIFAKEGQDGFRRIERDSLKEVAKMENAVIACGGGTPCFFNNMNFLNANGLTVYLETSEDVLLRRLVVLNQTRPLVAGKSELEIASTIETQLKTRRPFYEKAKIRWSGDKLETLSEINSTVESFISTQTYINNSDGSGL